MDFLNKTIRPQVKYKMIRDNLVGEIKCNRLRPRDRLPSERILSDKYNVARMTVRQATRSLMHSGYVVKSPHGGYLVAERSTCQLNLRRVNLIICGHHSSHSRHFIRHGCVAAVSRGFDPNIICVYPGSEYLAIEALGSDELSIVIGGISGHDDGVLRSILRAKGRVAVIGIVLSRYGIYSIIGSDKVGIKLAVDSLLAKGHKRIALVSSTSDSSNPILSTQINVWRKAMFDSGVSIRSVDRHLIAIDHVPLGGALVASYEAVRSYYARQRIRATAILCLSEESCVGTRAALHALNINVPSKVSVMGYSCTPEAALSIPPMSYIDVDLDAHIDVALDIFNNQQADGSHTPEEYRRTIILPSLHQGQSVASRV